MSRVEGTKRKDPNAILEYGFDWAEKDWLESGETIASAVWTIPTGLTKVSEEAGSEVTQVVLSGGTAGETYTITCHIVTTGGSVEGREDDRSIAIVVEER